MELTTGHGAYIPTTGTFWLAWSADETDPDADVHIFRCGTPTGDDVPVTAETSEGAGDTNITAGQILRVVTTIGAVEMLGVVLVGEETASSSASLNFPSVFTSTFDTYEIVVRNIVPATDNAAIYIRVTTDNGSSYEATNYVSDTFIYRAGASTGLGLTTAVQLMNSQDKDSGRSMTYTIRTYSPASTTLIKNFDGYGNAFSSDGNAYGCCLRADWRVTTAITGFQLIASAGNLESGVVRVYGMAKG